MRFRGRYGPQGSRNGQKLGSHSQNASDGEPASPCPNRLFASWGPLALLRPRPLLGQSCPGPVVQAPEQGPAVRADSASQHCLVNVPRHGSKADGPLATRKGASRTHWGGAEVPCGRAHPSFSDSSCGPQCATPGGTPVGLVAELCWRVPDSQWPSGPLQTSPGAWRPRASWAPSPGSVVRGGLCPGAWRYVRKFPSSEHSEFRWCVGQMISLTGKKSNFI